MEAIAKLPGNQRYIEDYGGRFTEMSMFAPTLQDRETGKGENMVSDRVGSTFLRTAWSLVPRQDWRGTCIPTLHGLIAQLGFYALQGIFEVLILVHSWRDPSL